MSRGFISYIIRSSEPKYHIPKWNIVTGTLKTKFTIIIVRTKKLKMPGNRQLYTENENRSDNVWFHDFFLQLIMLGFFSSLYDVEWMFHERPISHSALYFVELWPFHSTFIPYYILPRKLQTQHYLMINGYCTRYTIIAAIWILFHFTWKWTWIWRLYCEL